MSSDLAKRLSLVAGTGVFILVLIALLIVLDAGEALLLAVVSGLGAGVTVALLGAVVRPAPPVPATEPEPPAVPAPEAGGAAVATPAEPEPGSGGLPQDLHETVRLDQVDMGYVLPEIEPEDVLKEREGIDESALQQGIEPSPVSSENTSDEASGGGAKAA